MATPPISKTINEQMIIEMQDSGETKQVHIEDIGLLILDHQQITITQAVIAKLLANNVAFITCDNTHHPTGLMLNLDGNTLQSQNFQAQVDASIQLKKQLWQQTLMAKTENQAALLETKSKEYKLLNRYSKDVKSGDSENHEAKAAAYYWKRIFPDFIEFRRDNTGHHLTICLIIVMLFYAL